MRGLAPSLPETLTRPAMYDTREFRFDALLPPAATQAQTYAVVGSPVVAGVLDGYHGTILAYGPCPGLALDPNG
jgi:kinesin family protein 5